MPKAALENTSGLDFSNVDEVTSFLEVGLDSLSLTQVAIAFKKKFKVPLTFRQLLEDYTNLGALADYIEPKLPADFLPGAPIVENIATSNPVANLIPVNSIIDTSSSVISHDKGNSQDGYRPMMPINPVQTGAVEALVAQQLQIMTQQLELLKQGGSGSESAIPITPAIPQAPIPIALPKSAESNGNIAKSEEIAPKKSSGPGAKIEKAVSSVVSTEQQTYLDKIIARYTARTPESKRQTQEHRRYLADLCTVSGFTSLLKEMV